MIVNPQKALEFAFDVGHSSIGWAVLSSVPTGAVELLGCGAVTFRADDCLASSRRAYRRQRRHIRATRQRISRLKELLLHLGVMTREQLDTPGCAWPWLMAARTLKSSREGKPQHLTWAELWDVLRWYAHNRGYDGNRNWASEIESAGNAEEAEDMEKVKNARGLLSEFNAATMAECVCAVSGIDPMGKKRSCNVSPEKRFKARNAAFPREVVEAEVRRILAAHVGKLPKLDEQFIRALMEDWKALPCPAIKLPNRYAKGLLFGQLVPRFDNRIISKCPITGGKVPSRNCPEFLNFRWAMQLANIRISLDPKGELRPLDVPQREALDERIRRFGAFTAKELMDAVREITLCKRDNLETMLMHPDAKEALTVDPIQKKLNNGSFGALFEHLPDMVRKHARIRLRRGKSITLQNCLDEATRLKLVTSAFESALTLYLNAKNTKRSKKEGPLTREAILKEQISVKKLSQRAAYSRDILVRAYKEVIAGKPHPKEEGGCLFITEEMRRAQMNRPIPQQTNNHLVRHRLLILDRLFSDMVKEFASGDKQAISRITVEVNRDLKEMSGKTAKEKAQMLGQRLSNHRSVAEKLEAVLEKDKITAGLIRKARVAEDLGWTCPYTGERFDIPTLFHRTVDKDHIVPYSLRPSNSLESLVITFSEINKWKGARTAMQFITEEAGKPVPGRANLTLTTPDRFKKFVEALESYKGHDDDKRRKKRRKDLLLLAKYEEKEFTPGDLTQTSQLVRLAALSLKRHFQDQKNQPVIVSLPGSVTGTVRKSWNLIGCLAKANPQILDENGQPKSKGEIRDITHLHHALDACVIAFSSHFIPNNGRVWELIMKRNHTAQEEAELRALPIFQKSSDGRMKLKDFPPIFQKQIVEHLAEKRVVQHIPARMTGLRAEQNVWRVVSIKEGEAELTQTTRGPDQKRTAKPPTSEKLLKLIGAFPEDEKNGKLSTIKGVLCISENYGVALEPKPQIIPFHKVPVRLRRAKVENDGKAPRVVRNGQMIRIKTGNFAGIWRIFSVKNAAGGILLDMGFPDIVRLQSKGFGMKRQVSLATLLKSGLEVVPRTLTGISCPTTSSASTAPNAP